MGAGVYADGNPGCSEELLRGGGDWHVEIAIELDSLSDDGRRGGGAKLVYGVEIHAVSILAAWGYDGGEARDNIAWDKYSGFTGIHLVCFKQVGISQPGEE